MGDRVGDVGAPGHSGGETIQDGSGKLDAKVAAAFQDLKAPKPRVSGGVLTMTPEAQVRTREGFIKAMAKMFHTTPHAVEKALAADTKDGKALNAALTQWTKKSGEVSIPTSMPTLQVTKSEFDDAQAKKPADAKKPEAPPAKEAPLPPSKKKDDKPTEAKPPPAPANAAPVGADVHELRGQAVRQFNNATMTLPGDIVEKYNLKALADAAANGDAAAYATFGAALAKAKQDPEASLEKASPERLKSTASSAFYNALADLPPSLISKYKLEALATTATKDPSVANVKALLGAIAQATSEAKPSKAPTYTPTNGVGPNALNAMVIERGNSLELKSMDASWDVDAQGDDGVVAQRLMQSFAEMYDLAPMQVMAYINTNPELRKALDAAQAGKLPAVFELPRTLKPLDTSRSANADKPVDAAPKPAPGEGAKTIEALSATLRDMPDNLKPLLHHAPFLKLLGDDPTVLRKALAGDKVALEKLKNALPDGEIKNTITAGTGIKDALSATFGSFGDFLGAMGTDAVAKGMGLDKYVDAFEKVLAQPILRGLLSSGLPLGDLLDDFAKKDGKIDKALLGKLIDGEANPAEMMTVIRQAQDVCGGKLQLDMQTPGMQVLAKHLKLPIDPASLRSVTFGPGSKVILSPMPGAEIKNDRATIPLNSDLALDLNDVNLNDGSINGTMGVGTYIETAFATKFTPTGNAIGDAILNALAKFFMALFFPFFMLSAIDRKVTIKKNDEGMNQIDFKGFSFGQANPATLKADTDKVLDVKGVNGVSQPEGANVFTVSPKQIPADQRQATFDQIVSKAYSVKPTDVPGLVASNSVLGRAQKAWTDPARQDPVSFPTKAAPPDPTVSPTAPTDATAHKGAAAPGPVVPLDAKPAAAPSDKDVAAALDKLAYKGADLNSRLQAYQKANPTAATLSGEALRRHAVAHATTADARAVMENEPAKAGEMLRRAYAMYPSPGALLSLAQCEWLQGHKQEALALFDRVIKESENKPEYAQALAVAKEQRDQLIAEMNDSPKQPTKGDAAAPQKPNAAPSGAGLTLPGQLETKESRQTLKTSERAEITSGLLKQVGVDPGKTFTDVYGSVAGIQQWLKISVDGQWGPETNQALNDYLAKGGKVEDLQRAAAQGRAVAAQANKPPTIEGNEPLGSLAFAGVHVEFKNGDLNFKDGDRPVGFVSQLHGAKNIKIGNPSTTVVEGGQHTVTIPVWVDGQERTFQFGRVKKD